MAPPPATPHGLQHARCGAPPRQAPRGSRWPEAACLPALPGCRVSQPLSSLPTLVAEARGLPSAGRKHEFRRTRRLRRLRHGLRFLLLSSFLRMDGLGIQRPWLAVDEGAIRFPDTRSGAQTRAFGLAATSCPFSRIRSCRSSFQPTGAKGVLQTA